MYIVYKITRDDGQLYIGTTYSGGVKSRMSAHSRSNRFRGYEFKFDILEKSDDFDYIADREEYYIELYDTYNNGLNESIDGKGNHLCDNFTTKGFKFTEYSKQKMSESAKRRIKRDGVPFKGCSHTLDQRKKWSIDRKGMLPPNTKLTECIVKEIIKLFEDHPFIEGVGDIMKNGRCMSYIRAFSLKFSDKYNITPQQIERIIKGRVWKNVERKYTI
jgi:hypothetical protein